MRTAPAFEDKPPGIRVAFFSSDAFTSLQLHAPARGDKPLRIRVALFSTGGRGKACITLFTTPCTRVLGRNYLKLEWHCLAVN